MKPNLLVVEQWGLGDLIIASPFLQTATEKYDVTLVAQPHAQDMRLHFWPEVKCQPFAAPWTVHRRKYRLHRWPWRRIFRLVHTLRRQRFDLAVAGRWDPRDHLILWLSGARRRLGYSRAGSRVFLTESLDAPDPLAHRTERWRLLGEALQLEVPPVEDLIRPVHRPGGTVLVHTGAGKFVRVWPLERYQRMIGRLREAGYRVQLACDPEQLNWWMEAGEKEVCAPHSVDELLNLVDAAAFFIGNDSGPGHLAGYRGVPTFTIFGPQVPEWFAPLHPQARWINGAPCPYRPCYDYCRFPETLCLARVTEERVWEAVKPLVRAHVALPRGMLSSR